MVSVTDARRIARVLMDVASACPAAIRVAFIDKPWKVVRWQDNVHLRTLERHGCLLAGRMTAFGQQVTTMVRAVHGVQAWSLRESS